MSKVILIGANNELVNRMMVGRVTTTRRDWSAVKRRPDALADADVIFADLTVPGAYTVRGLANLRKAHPHLSFVLRTDADLASSAAMIQLLDSPNMDFVRSAADADEVRLRVHRLLKLRRSQNAAPPRASNPIAQHLVPEMHHPDNGRLDARRVAEFFGTTLAEVARALGKSLSAVHKTPHARSLQQGLFVFERVAVALLTLAGSKEAARAWLRLPEKQFSGNTPLAVILEGRGHLVAELLDDMMIGQPS